MARGRAAGGWWYCAICGHAITGSDANPWRVVTQPDGEPRPCHIACLKDAGEA